MTINEYVTFHNFKQGSMVLIFLLVHNHDLLGLKLVRFQAADLAHTQVTLAGKQWTFEVGLPNCLFSPAVCGCFSNKE